MGEGRKEGGYREGKKATKERRVTKWKGEQRRVTTKKGERTRRKERRKEEKSEKKKGKEKKGGYFRLSRKGRSVQKEGG
jgi:hypothetical protein